MDPTPAVRHDDICCVGVSATVVEPSFAVQEELVRDPVSAGQAVIWLRYNEESSCRSIRNSAAFSSLIASGIAQVSLLRYRSKQQRVQKSDPASGFQQDPESDVRGHCGEVAGGSSCDFWVPVVVRSFPDAFQEAQKPEQIQLQGSERRWLPSSTHTEENGNTLDESESTSRCSCSAFLSPCVADALGLPRPIGSTRHATTRVVTSVQGPAEAITLSVRELRNSLVKPAAAIELAGPYSISTVQSSDDEISAKGGGRNQGLIPAPSAGAAISSILPGALEGDLLTVGSVVRVAGLFKFIVTAVRPEKGHRGRRHGPEAHGPADGGQSRATDSDGGCDRGVVVRVNGATALRILSASMHRALAATSVGSSSSTPAYNSRDSTEWIRQVERDFGGLRNQVATAVRIVGSALRGNGRRSGGQGVGGGLNGPASGLLLHGPTGVGKTLLARSVAEKSGAACFLLDCSSVFRRDRCKAEQFVQEFLVQAAASSPSVVILDQVESVSRRRPEGAGITELQVFSVLLEAMDSFRRRDHYGVPSTVQSPNVFFLATCPDASALDPSLLQRGRLESVLRLGALDDDARASVLGIYARSMPLRVAMRPSKASMAVSSQTTDLVTAAALATGKSGDFDKGQKDDDSERECPTADTNATSADATQAPPLLPSSVLPTTRDEFFRLVAARCHGYLGSDLERLCREATMQHMAASGTAAFTTSRRSPNGAAHLRAGGEAQRGSFPGDDEGQDRDEIRLEDFWAALNIVRPASLVGLSAGMWGGGGREKASTETPLVGCDAAMAELRTFLLAPLTKPSLLRSLGLRAAGGALLHGPPGCGKTSVARALALEGKSVANFLEVRCSDLVDKVVGRSERAVSDLFAAARAAAPCVLFLDQVEGVAARRGYHSSTEQTFDRILSTLLVEMDGVMSESGGHVVVLAATNDITRLDPALLRPGRLDRSVYLGSPDVAARTAIFLQRLRGMPLEMVPRGESGESAVHCSTGSGDSGGTISDSGVDSGDRGSGGGVSPPDTRVGSVDGGVDVGVSGRKDQPPARAKKEGDNLRGGDGRLQLTVDRAQLPADMSTPEVLLPAEQRDSESQKGRLVFNSAEAYAKWLASETEGDSGAQVTGVCREAALAALREGIGTAEVAPRHFEVALGGRLPKR